jgi:hypothetical protein
MSDSPDLGNFLERVATLVVEDDRCPLLRWESGKGREKLRGFPRHLVSGIHRRSSLGPSPLQLARSDPKRGSPHPGCRISDRRPAGDQLREGLRQSIARDIGAARGQSKSAPQPVSLFTVDSFDSGTLTGLDVCLHLCIVHLSDTGRKSAGFFNAKAPRCCETYRCRRR